MTSVYLLHYFGVVAINYYFYYYYYYYSFHDVRHMYYLSGCGQGGIQILIIQCWIEHRHILLPVLSQVYRKLYFNLMCD